MREVGIDFETFSEREIKTAGSFEYATDPSTELICMCWKWKGEEKVYRYGFMPEVLYYSKTVHLKGNPEDIPRAILFAALTLINRGWKAGEAEIWALGKWGTAGGDEGNARLLAEVQDQAHARSLKKQLGYDKSQAYTVEVVKVPIYETVEFGREDLDHLLEEVVKDDVIVSAFSISFERPIWEHVCHRRMGWPSLEKFGIKKWKDTMAIAKAHTLPGSLGDCAEALGLTEQKDKLGNKEMLQISKPKKPSKKDPHDRVWDPEKWRRVVDYCAQDVIVEQAIGEKLLPLDKIGPQEQAIWELDQEMNHDGIPIDRDTVVPALDVLSEAENRLNKKLQELTGREDITLSKRDPLIEWLSENGLNTNTVAKEFVEAYKDDPDLPEIVQEVLNVKYEGSKSGVKKIPRMEDMTRFDGRARYANQYYGASTGRWAGRGIQFQNLIKGKAANIQDVDKALACDLLAKAIRTGDYDVVDLLFGDPLEALSTVIRSLVYAPGDNEKLIFSDYSAIEARGAAWVAGEQRMLELFATDQCVYKDMTGAIYGIPNPQSMPKSDPRRQIGKQAVLGLGYGMGGLKFEESCQKAGIEIDLDFAEEVRRTYRETNAEIVQSWWDLDNAAVAAVKNPGVEYEARRCCFWKKPGDGSALFCQLPSGRRLIYFAAKIKQEKTPWGKMRDLVFYKGIDSQAASKKWGWNRMYGGKWMENVVQAVSRDIMVHAMLRLKELGHKILFTVHDEIVLLVDQSVQCSTIEEIMCETPAWADGFPVAAEAEEGKRYRK